MEQFSLSAGFALKSSLQSVSVEYHPRRKREAAQKTWVCVKALESKVGSALRKEKGRKKEIRC